MTIRRYGNCAECNKRIMEVRDFPETIDMFREQPANTISGEIADAVRAWKAEPMYCEDHK